MTWIRTVPLSEAGERLKAALAAQQALYPREYAEPVHRAERDERTGEQMAGIVASHSLIPEALYHAFATFGALMSPELPLGRRQHELIAAVVSLTNRCRYWIESHAEFLRRVTLDDDLVRALREDVASAPLTPEERVLVEYVIRLTKDATRISPRDHEGLRGAGFDDTAILQITLIASWFNYINRVADALGVGRGDG